LPAFQSFTADPPAKVKYGGHDVNEYRYSIKDSGDTHHWLLGLDTNFKRIGLIWIKDGKWYRMVCLCLDAGPYGVYTLLITSFVSAPTFWRGEKIGIMGYLDKIPMRPVSNT
jgi:hypothetical protein